MCGPWSKGRKGKKRRGGRKYISGTDEIKVKIGEGQRGKAAGRKSSGEDAGGENRRSIGRRRCPNRRLGAESQSLLKERFLPPPTADFLLPPSWRVPDRNPGPPSIWSLRMWALACVCVCETHTDYRANTPAETRMRHLFFLPFPFTAIDTAQNKFMKIIMKKYIYIRIFLIIFKN